MFLIGLLYFTFLLGLANSLLWLGFLVGKRTRSVGREPLSPYECGFQSMSSARIPFSLKFYLLGIIFLLFDVELVIAFPYFMIPEGGEGMFVFLYLFFLILLFGLVHETNEGSLEWR